MKLNINFSKRIILLVMLSVSISIFGQTKPKILILATGGTIAGSAKTGVQSGYTSGQVTICLLYTSPSPRD